MSRESRPLRDCLDDLAALVKQGASGSFYLAGANNDIAAITLTAGVIESVNFQGRRGDFAVEMLKNMPMASCSFRAGAPGPSRQSQLSNHAVRWLTGGTTAAPSAGASPPASRSAGGASAAPHRKTIESIAYAFLGPIASAVCDGAFAEHSELAQVIEELAASMPPEEAGYFRKEIAKALATK